MNENIKENLVFTTKQTARNSDVLFENDKFISYNEGDIHKLRIFTDGKTPLILGKYFYYTIALEEIKKSEYDLVNFLDLLYSDDCFVDFKKTIKENKDIEGKILKHNRIFILSYIIVSPEARGKKIILSEFMKMFCKNNYSEDVIIVGYFKPIQHNWFFTEIILDEENIEIKDHIKDPPTIVSSREFYKIENLSKSTDYEFDCLKLHSLAQRNGFSPLNQKNNLFVYKPQN